MVITIEISEMDEFCIHQWRNKNFPKGNQSRDMELEFDLANKLLKSVAVAKENQINKKKIT